MRHDKDMNSVDPPAPGASAGRNTMSILTVDDQPVAEVEVARSFSARSKGLLGRDGITTGLVLEPASSVHTFGMRFAIDVAYVARGGRVLAVRTMPAQRLGLPRLRSRWVLETQAQRMAEWGIHPGAQLNLL
jgi:uncharacterized membrane protein (UPF0127 family)